MIPVLVLALLLAGEADGQSARKENAASLLKMGVESRRKGDHEEALQKFRQAHDMAPCGQTLVQMGLAEQSLQRWVDSEDHLSRGLDEADDWVRKYRQVIETSLGTVRGHVGLLEIAGPEGAQIAINGQPRGVLPLREVRLNEGQVAVSIQVPGQAAWSRSLMVGGGSHSTLVFASLPASAPSPTAMASPAPVASSTSARDWHDWLGGSLIGAGLVAAGFGTYALIKDGDCTGGEGCPSVFASKSLGLASVGVGAAAVLTGSLVIITGGKRGENQVALGARPGGIVVRGRF